MPLPITINATPATKESLSPLFERLGTHCIGQTLTGVYADSAKQEWVLGFENGAEIRVSYPVNEHLMVSVSIARKN